MESKKINQLATELAPDLSDLTIIGDPTTGISKKITLSQMASLFTGTVEEYATLAAFPLVGVADTIYIALDTNVIYRYDTSLSAYVILSPNIINSLVFSDANGFDGTITLVGSVATLSITTALTLGSVPFIGASGALSQDNANLFFDDTNNRLGIATASPTTPLDVFGSGIIGRLNATSTNNAYLGFASNGTNKWSAGNVQSDHRFRIFSEANSAELITILQTGEFGIGISNPTTKFHIDGAATALIANLDANVSVAKTLSFRSDNSARINLEVSGTESGSNAGADFFLRTFTDAGSLLETPFSIVRSTGVTTIKSLTLTNALSVANGGTGSTTQNFVDLTTTQTIAGLKTFSSEVSASSGLITLSGNAGTAPTGMVGLRYVANRLLIYGGSTDFTVQKNSNSGPNLTILESGAATFTSSVTATNLILTAGTLFGTGATGFSNRLSDTTLYLQMPATGFNITDNALNTKFILSSTGAATFNGEVNITSGLLSMSGSGGTTPSSGVGLRFVANRLLIYGGTEDITFQKNSNASANMRILEAGQVGINTIDAGVQLAVKSTSTTSSTYPFFLFNSANTGVFHVRSDGYVNTGATTASPYNLTTASAANMFVDSGGGLNRSTSSIRFKTEIEDLIIDTSNILSKMRPIWYRSLGQNDRKDWSWYGFIAEEMAELEPRLVQWGYDSTSYETIEIKDEEGNIKQETKLKEDAVLIPDGVQYERITVFLVAELQKMRKELDALKAK